LLETLNRIVDLDARIGNVVQPPPEILFEAPVQ
jgi:hypothetical protein